MRTAPSHLHARASRWIALMLSTTRKVSEAVFGRRSLSIPSLTLASKPKALVRVGLR
jgi:hypothetical protein